ncbi:MAG: glycosyltransferase family 4 protein, partial [Anaerolineales bacterium]|nr:glycosyltransferase family 4 protein [Anaerolineales bacterium]
HTLLRALDQVPHQQWKLDIVGNLEADLYYSLAMQRHVAQSGWQKQVRFWGPLDHDNLADRYREANLLVMPSEYESFGIVYLEAMSFGVPPVGSTAGAAKEIITHGENGFLIAPDDQDALSNIIKNVHTNRPYLLELSQNARTRYEAHPTWTESCAQIHQFLQQVAP